MNVCRICGNDLSNSEYELTEMFLCTRERFDYFKCSACGTMQSAGILDCYDKYYPANYYSFATSDNIVPKQGSVIQNLKKSIIRIRDRSVLTSKGLIGKTLGTFFPDIEKKLNSLRFIRLTEESRILDVGCGNGEFVRYLNELGMKNVTGIDSYLPGDLDLGNGIRAIKANMHEIAEKGMSFDLIMMHHVIEHMHDPFEALNSSLQMLADNGRLIIRTPNAESYAWERFGTNWVQLDAPRHIHVFSAESLRSFAERAGFKVLKVDFDSTEFQFWGSIQYENGICLNASDSFMTDPSNSIFSASDISDFKKHSEKLNASYTGDQFAMYLCKA